MLTVTTELWVVYKEVATYHAAGLNPPEDVTIMFTDDNWGNVMRLPTEEERRRAGGFGVSDSFPQNHIGALLISLHPALLPS